MSSGCSAVPVVGGGLRDTNAASDIAVPKGASCRSYVHVGESND